MKERESMKENTLNKIIMMIHFEIIGCKFRIIHFEFFLMIANVNFTNNDNYFTNDHYFVKYQFHYL